MLKLIKGDEAVEKITLSEEITDDKPKIIGDSSQLQEVFFNLLDNADDAIKGVKVKQQKNKDYKPKITIDTSPVNNSFVCVTIEDNGLGISKDNMEKLFVPFYTSKATSEKGKGLGLYVIDRIINSHGGKITVDSQYGRGTKFHIYLKKS
jgi:two-component system NtrC family sensor kinase